MEFHSQPALGYCDARGNLLMTGRWYDIDGLCYILLMDSGNDKCSFYRGYWYRNNLYNPDNYGEKISIEVLKHDYYNPWKLINVWPIEEVAI